VDLKRGLEAVSRTQNKKRTKTETDSPPLPWQFAAIEQLTPTQRWVIAGPLQKLWPAQEAQEVFKQQVVVLYPDLFGKDFGYRSHDKAVEDLLSGNDTKRWKEARNEFGSIASSLPLARVMGAQVVPHLTNGISHVLSDLRHDHRTVRLDAFDADKFVDPKHARRIKVRLSGMADPGKAIIFVSPAWIRQEFLSM